MLLLLVVFPLVLITILAEEKITEVVLFIFVSVAATVVNTLTRIDFPISITFDVSFRHGYDTSILISRWQRLNITINYHVIIIKRIVSKINKHFKSLCYTYLIMATN